MSDLDDGCHARTSDVSVVNDLNNGYRGRVPRSCVTVGCHARLSDVCDVGSGAPHLLPHGAHSPEEEDGNYAHNYVGCTLLACNLRNSTQLNSSTVGKVGDSP